MKKAEVPLAAGVHIVPFMDPHDVVTLAIEAERIGYDYCLIADEGFQVDVFSCLSVIATRTSRIEIGPVTNGYTRHPAVIASALATLDSLSHGRAIVTLLAGGSMVLEPMGIAREKPFRVVSDTIEMLRLLWTGEEVTWSGHLYRLERARLAGGLMPVRQGQDGSPCLPIWVASRGPMILDLAGRRADGVLLTVKPDVGSALDIVRDGARSVSRPPPAGVYLGRICYTPEMVAAQRATLSYVLMDSPPRVLRALELDDDQIDLVARAVERNQPGLLDSLATDDLMSRYQVIGSADQCAQTLASMATTHRLEAVMADVLSTDLAENLDLLEKTFEIVSNAREAAA